MHKTQTSKASNIQWRSNWGLPSRRTGHKLTTPMVWEWASSARQRSGEAEREQGRRESEQRERTERERERERERMEERERVRVLVASCSRRLAVSDSSLSIRLLSFPRSVLAETACLLVSGWLPLLRPTLTPLALYHLYFSFFSHSLLFFTTPPHFISFIRLRSLLFFAYSRSTPNLG